MGGTSSQRGNSHIWNNVFIGTLAATKPFDILTSDGKLWGGAKTAGIEDRKTGEPLEQCMIFKGLRTLSVARVSN